MAVTFKMKLIFVWICLIAEAFPFPTQAPNNVNDTKVCCEKNPMLIYKGHDSKGGLNVYVYEYLPQSKEAKDKRVEDTTMKNGLQGNRNAPKGEENGENYKDTIIPTNKPGTKKTFDSSTHMPDLKFDTIDLSAAQNDIEMDDTGLLFNATKGLQTAMSHSRDMQKTSGHSNGDDYYGTEGSALDIPGYSETDTGNQSLKVDFPVNVNGFVNNLGCSEYKGCKIPPKSKEGIFVTQPTTQKDMSYSQKRRTTPDAYANREGNTKNRAVIWSMKPTKTTKYKNEKQTDRNINTKYIPVRHNTGKIIQYSSGLRRKFGGNRHISKYYKRSSSESSSDSSQEFD